MCNLTAGFSDSLSGIHISCPNITPKLDLRNIEINRLLQFQLSIQGSSTIYPLKVHLLHSTRLIQIQRSSYIQGTRTPVWFVEIMLRLRFEHLAKERSNNIKGFNDSLSSLYKNQTKSLNRVNCSSCSQPFTIRKKQDTCQTCGKLFHSEKCMTDHNCPAHPLTSVSHRYLLLYQA